MMDVRRGPAKSEEERQTARISYQSSNFIYPVSLMAPPIALQERIQVTSNCSTIAGTEYTQTLWNKATTLAPLRIGGGGEEFNQLINGQPVPSVIAHLGRKVQTSRNARIAPSFSAVFCFRQGCLVTVIAHEREDSSFQSVLEFTNWRALIMHLSSTMAGSTPARRTVPSSNLDHRYSTAAAAAAAAASEPLGQIGFVFALAEPDRPTSPAQKKRGTGRCHYHRNHSNSSFFAPLTTQLVHLGHIPRLLCVRRALRRAGAVAGPLCHHE